MTIKKPTIGVVFCGGETTIAGSTSVTRVARKSDIDTWLEAFPEIKILADIKPLYFNNANGAIIDGHRVWADMAKKLWHLRSGVDGIVVSYPVSQLAFMSAALQTMMPSMKVPVITTGADVQITDEEDLDFVAYQTLGVKANFINAVHTAALDVAGVGLLYNTGIYQASDVTREKVKAQNTFASYSGYELGQVDFSVHLSDERLRRGDVTAEYLDARLDSRVAVLRWVPGMRIVDVAAAIPSGSKGVLLKADKNLVDDKKFVRNLVLLAKKIPTFVHTNTDIDMPEKMLLSKRPFELAVAQVMAFAAGAPLQRFQTTLL